MRVLDLHLGVTGTSQSMNPERTTYYLCFVQSYHVYLNGCGCFREKKRGLNMTWFLLVPLYSFHKGRSPNFRHIHTLCCLTATAASSRNKNLMMNRGCPILDGLLDFLVSAFPLGQKELVSMCSSPNPRAATLHSGPLDPVSPGESVSPTCFRLLENMFFLFWI